MKQRFWHMLRRKRTGLLAAGLMLAGLVGAGLAAAQTGGGYELTWWTVDGGGATGISGGDYVLLHTIGQPDAADAVSGGDYIVESGFWPSFVETHFVYLPLVIKPGQPDLVGTFSLNPAGPTIPAGQPVLITVVVQNIGTAAASPFWVDLYINPSALPAVNQRWNDLCSLSPCYGLAWYVDRDLQPGESITLTSGNFETAYSRWPGYFASGTTDLYTYVDTWNPTVPTGGVLEKDETNNMFHIGGLNVAGVHVTVAEPQPAAIPPRPVRLR